MEPPGSHLPREAWHRLYRKSAGMGPGMKEPTDPGGPAQAWTARPTRLHIVTGGRRVHFLRDSLQRFQPLGEFRFARHTDPLAHFRSLTKPPTRCVQKISL